MKNIVLGLILMLSLQTFAQGKFRGMEWGATSSELKSKNPSVQWKVQSEVEFKIFITDDYVGGLKVQVVYCFDDDKLMSGGYIFNVNHSSNNLYYEDFISISTILNEKYAMERSEKWNDTTWKENPNYIGHALKMGDVEINETFENSQTSIVHNISSDDNMGIEHVLFYYDLKYSQKKEASKLEDF